LMASHTVVIDGTDDIKAKFLLSDEAVRTGVPLVYGGVLRMQGQVMMVGTGGPCLRCIFEEPLDEEQVPSCARAGVLGTVAGIIGGIQARLALDALTGKRNAFGQLIAFDGWKLSQRVIPISRAADCPACGGLHPARPQTSWAETA